MGKVVRDLPEATLRQNFKLQLRLLYLRRQSLNFQIGLIDSLLPIFDIVFAEPLKLHVLFETLFGNLVRLSEFLNFIKTCSDWSLDLGLVLQQRECARQGVKASWEISGLVIAGVGVRVLAAIEDLGQCRFEQFVVGQKFKQRKDQIYYLAKALLRSLI